MTTDEELVARSRGGDLDSFNQLVVRWERPIYALAYRVIGREEEARDVAQETFLRAFRALGGQFTGRQHDGMSAAAMFWHVQVVAFAFIWYTIYITK